MTDFDHVIMTRRPIAFACHSPVFGIGPERDGPYLLASGVGDAITTMLRADGHDAIAAEATLTFDPETPHVLSSGAVLEQPAVQEALRSTGCEAVTVFKANRHAARVAHGMGIDLLAPPTIVARQIENKLTLPELAREAQVTCPQSTTVVVDAVLPQVAAPLLARGPMVFQTAVSFAGAMTRLISDVEDLAPIIDAVHGKAGKLVEFVEGDPLTIAGVVLDAETILVGGVARQLTGIASLTAHVFGACGNEWTTSLPSAAVESCRTVTARVGRAMAARGFRGVFGVDVVATAAGSVTLIEVNPRFTANLSLALQLQQTAGQPTFFDAHCLAFGRIRASVASGNPARLQSDLVECYREASMVAQPHRNISVVLLYNTCDGPVTPPARLRPGIWTTGFYAGGQPAYLRDGYRIDHLRAADEILVLANPGGRPVESGTEIARIVVQSTATEHGDPGVLSPDVARIVSSLVSSDSPIT